jgi:hypothetical protein
MKTKAVEVDTSQAIQNFTIPTSETVSAQFLMKHFLGVDHYPMLVGKAGCGKT